MEKSFSDLIKEIRPLIIKGIQDAKVREYEQIYKGKNGKIPSKDEINQFIAILIANGTVKRDANEILNELSKRYNKKLLINTIINTFVIFGSVSIFIIYILIYLKTKMGWEIVGDDYLISAPNFVLAMILCITNIFLFILTNIKNNDD
ncbi:MAG: hypothetical protein M0Q43_05650 [Methanothrix sp.]|jgi:hypothetical protein|nr:hypothetical protein [Methanothrix sp.]